MRSKLIIAAFCAAALIAGGADAFTINGSQVASLPTVGGYPRVSGIVLGGIGTGSFVFLPNGTYNRQWLHSTAQTGVEPTILVYANVGGSAWSTQTLTTAGGFGITYTGYWPKATLQYSNANLRIGLTLEAFSPLYPGSDRDCSLPVAFFVFSLSNPTGSSVQAAIACRNSATTGMIMNGPAVQGLSGTSVTMMVKNDGAATVSCGTTANVADFTADGQFTTNTAGGTLASLVTLAAGETRTVTFIITWDNIVGYYRNFFGTSRLVADYCYTNAERLKAKVDNWHNKILNSNLPGWYKDILINNCHGLNSQYQWATSVAAGVTQGDESVTDSRTDCFDQRIYSSIITPIFAPQCEYQIMKKYANDQAADGHILYAFGYTASKNDANSFFPVLLLRNYMWTGQTRFITEFYSNIQRSLQYNKNDDRGDGSKNNYGVNGIPDDQFTTFDQPYYDGWMPSESEYASQCWLTGLKAGKRFAEISTDAARAATYQSWYDQASATFERTAGSGGYWNNTTAGPTGLRGFYTGSNTPTAGRGQACWVSQLAGQWYADFLQLGLNHPQGRIDSAIAYVNALNGASRGYYLAIMPDRSNWFGRQPGGNQCGEQWPWFPPAHFGGAAISQGFPDIGMRCIYSNWLSNYSGQVASVGPIPWNSPVFMMVNGSDAPNLWGAYRYQNPPGVFSTLFAITGFSIDVANRKLWLKPSVPQDSMGGVLVNAPLINPLSCGTLDYTPSTPYGQRLLVKFDTTMTFSTITLKDQNSAVNPIYISVTKSAAPVAFTSTRQGSGKSAEIALNFSAPVAVDSNGVLIIVDDQPVGVKSAAAGFSRQASPVVFPAAIHNGAVRLPLSCHRLDKIEIFGLKGEIKAKGTVAEFLQKNATKVPDGLYICAIKSAR